MAGACLGVVVIRPSLAVIHRLQRQGGGANHQPSLLVGQYESTETMQNACRQTDLPSNPQNYAVRSPFPVRLPIEGKGTVVPAPAPQYMRMHERTEEPSCSPCSAAVLRKGWPAPLMQQLLPCSARLLCQGKRAHRPLGLLLRWRLVRRRLPVRSVCCIRRCRRVHHRRRCVAAIACRRRRWLRVARVAAAGLLRRVAAVWLAVPAAATGCLLQRAVQKAHCKPTTPALIDRLF